MAERRKSNFTPFKKGDKVWLDSRNLKTIYHKKMAPKWEGPFIITEVLGPITYRLQLPASWKIHNVFNATLLWPYRENEIYGKNYPEPSAELEDGEEVYKVETILNHRKRGRSYQYYVKWKGYPVSDASWEPEQAFSDDSDTLSLYKQRHKLWNPKQHAFPQGTTTQNKLDVHLAAQWIVWHHGWIVLYKVGTRERTKPNCQQWLEFWPVQNNRKILKTSLSTILLFLLLHPHVFATVSPWTRPTCHHAWCYWRNGTNLPKPTSLYPWTSIFYLYQPTHRQTRKRDWTSMTRTGVLIQ